MAEEKDKPVFDKPAYDEQTLAKLLEAAYVLQEHNRELRQREVTLELQRDQLGAEERAASARLGSVTHPPSSPAAKDEADYTQTLAQIVETQRQIHARNLKLPAAMDLVAERITEIAKAGGAAIGILAGKNVRYRAVARGMTLPAGTEVAMEKALCVASLRTGQVIRCTDVNAEFLLDVEECQRRGIQSMIAVPVYHDGGIAGGLELYYANAQGFTEQDVHTCQLMAGLVTEALVREEEVAPQKSVADQRTAMREALEKIRPAVAVLAGRASNQSAIAAAGSTASTKVFACGKCGHQLVGEEQFCGNCGTPRSGDYGPPSLQSKVAALWQMQEALKNAPAASSENAAAANQAAGPSSPAGDQASPIQPVVRSLPTDHAESELPVAVEPYSLEPGPLEPGPLEPGPSEPSSLRVPISIPGDNAAPVLVPPFDLSIESSIETQEDRAHTPAEATALAVTEQPWSSAAAARDYLERLAGNKNAAGFAQFLSARRGDVYLVVAVIVVAIVMLWGIWSNHPVNATANSSAAAAHHKPDPNADLSWFDRLLINMGLAEAPPPPESKGNPETQVWVDLHTALYYCPGTDLYGKTPKGKYTSQRDAQLDSFGPASGRPCD